MNRGPGGPSETDGAGVFAQEAAEAESRLALRHFIENAEALRASASGARASLTFRAHRAASSMPTLGLKSSRALIEAEPPHQDASDEIAGLRVLSLPQPRPSERPAWLRFTPATIVSTCCLARSWGGGKGGQCKGKPLPDSKLCAQHTGNAVHGLVHGPIPDRKLQEFLAFSQGSEAPGASASSAAAPASDTHARAPGGRLGGGSSRAVGVVKGQQRRLQLRALRAELLHENVVEGGVGATRVMRSALLSRCLLSRAHDQGGQRGSVVPSDDGAIASRTRGAARRFSQRPECKDSTPKRLRQDDGSGQQFPRHFFSRLDESCGACLCEFSKRACERLALLDACQPKHAFHPSCIRKWAKKENSCPQCKQTFASYAEYSRRSGELICVKRVGNRKQRCDFGDSDVDDHMVVCCICMQAGNDCDLLLCDGMGGNCNAPYHYQCLGLSEIPSGDWLCPACARLTPATDVVGAHAPPSPLEQELEDCSVPSSSPPHCPRCRSGPMAWSVLKEGECSSGWICENVGECGRGGSPEVPRWFCQLCEVDLCGKCHEAQSRERPAGIAPSTAEGRLASQPIG